MDSVASEVRELRLDFSSSGDNTLLASPGAGKKWRVLGGFATSAGAVDLLFKSGSTAISGATTLASKAEASIGEFTLDEDEALVGNLSSGVGVVGVIRYVLIEGI